MDNFPLYDYVEMVCALRVYLYIVHISYCDTIYIDSISLSPFINVINTKSVQYILFLKIFLSFEPSSAGILLISDRFYRVEDMSEVAHGN